MSTHIYSRSECLFHYCPHPDICRGQDTCEAPQAPAAVPSPPLMETILPTPVPGANEDCPPYKRTPILRLELQLWPQPPAGSRPYWCYLRTLQFHDDQHRVVWQRDIHEIDLASNSRLIEDGDFGWVLVLVFRHEKAKAVLPRLKLPVRIGDGS